MRRLHASDDKVPTKKVVQHVSPKRERERDVVIPPRKTGIVRRKRP